MSSSAILAGDHHRHVPRADCRLNTAGTRWGPGLRFRPDGSVHPAVEGMIEEYQSAYLNFVLGLIAFHFSAALFGWLMFNCEQAPA